MTHRSASRSTVTSVWIVNTSGLLKTPFTVLSVAKSFRSALSCLVSALLFSSRTPSPPRRTEHQSYEIGVLTRSVEANLDRLVEAFTARDNALVRLRVTVFRLFFHFAHESKSLPAHCRIIRGLRTEADHQLNQTTRLGTMNLVWRGCVRRIVYCAHLLRGRLRIWLSASISTTRLGKCNVGVVAGRSDGHSRGIVRYVWDGF